MAWQSGLAGACLVPADLWRCVAVDAGRVGLHAASGASSALDGVDMTVVKSITLGLAAAVVVGLLDGGLARVLMRGVALATNEVTAFSWEATLGIMLIFAITAV